MSVLPEIPVSFYFAALPVFLLCIGSIVAMMQGAYNAKPTSVFLTVMIFMIGALVTSLIPAEADIYLSGTYLSGSLARFGQVFILVVTVGVALLFRETYLNKKFFSGEIACLYQMVVAGMVVLVSSEDLITFFIGLELSSIGIYALIGYIDPNRRSQEGALKYFVLGSFASAFILLGFGLLYAATGSLNLTEIASNLAALKSHSWIQLGALFTLVGLGFKLSLVPFHMWTPDAYEAAPTGITAVMAISMKVMMLIFTMRFLGNGMPTMAESWLPILLFLSILSMIVGNIMALVQNSLKRMLAYSSIAHSGYMAIAMCVMGRGDSFPFEAVMFYLIGYALASLAAFGVLMWLESEKAENLTLDDIAGLAKSHPWAAFALAVTMFSFAGMPPTVGFIGKFFVFSAAVKGQLYGLVIVGAIGSTISLYYYLRVIVKMYMKETNELTPSFTRGRSIIVGSLVAIALVATLLLGTVLPGTVMDQMQKPARTLLIEN